MTKRSRVGIVDRPHISPWLLWAAEHHAALADQIEGSRPDGRRYPWIEHRAYIVSAIIASVSFLEALINELFQDVDDRAEGLLLPGDRLRLITEPIPEDVQERMRDYWAETKGGWAPTLEKYGRVLEFAGAEPFDAKTLDDADVILEVRSALVHFRPRDHFTAKEAHTLGTRLKGRRPRFAPNPLVGDSDRAYWPEHALGAGLALWGISAARAVADHTSAALGIEPSYAEHKRGSWFDAEPGALELYMRRGRPRRSAPATDDRTSVFGIPYQPPDRDEAVGQYLNRSMHKLHIAEWHRAEFERLEGELTTLDFFDFEAEPFLPAQAHADAALIQLAAGFDAFACAVAHRYRIAERDPHRASFGGDWWTAGLIDAAEPELANLIRSVVEDPSFDGLTFYRNLAAHRGVIGEQQRGGSVDEVGTDGVRFMLPDWLPIEAPDYPSFTVRPILGRYIAWGRPVLAGLNALASAVWNLEDDPDGELVLGDEMFDEPAPQAEEGAVETEAPSDVRALTPEDLAPQLRDWRAWFEWGRHDFGDASTVLPAWYLRHGEADPVTLSAVDLEVEGLRRWLEEHLGPTVAKAILWHYRPRHVMPTNVGRVLAPGLRR